MTTPTNLPVLRLDNVRKSFHGIEVLHNISFDVNEHEVVALLGPSGSGKSTLMKCINLLEQVDDGQIWLSDTDITDPRIDQDHIRSRIGVVFQQFNLFPHMSVMKNVTLGAVKVHHWPKDKAESRALELLDRIGMRAYEDQCTPANPRIPLIEDMEDIAIAAYYGVSQAEGHKLRVERLGVAATEEASERVK